jgi:very-short-patch-repair endonuclease
VSTQGAIPSISASVDSLGGVVALRELMSVGCDRRAIERAAHRRDIVRVRPGVYASMGADPFVVRAARVGGKLAGASAARALGWWSPPSHPLTVEVPRSATRLRDPDDPSVRLDYSREDVRILWSGARELQFGTVSGIEIVRQILSLEQPAFATAVIDSALRVSAISRFELDDLARSLPPARRRVLRLASGEPESGTESVLAAHLAMAGVNVRAQAPVPFTKNGRFDFLIGDRLVIECDSETHHGGREQRLRDLRRDALAVGWGFVVLRFDYQQVLFDIDSVMATILACVERGEHRHPRRK